MDGLRVPARFAIVVYLALAVLAAVGLARVQRALRPRHALVLAVLCGVAILVEGHTNLAIGRVLTPDVLHQRMVYRWLRTRPAGPMLELPAGERKGEPLYTLGTLQHGNRVVNGYSGYGSLLLGLASGPPFKEIEQSDDGLGMLRAIGVRYLVVHSDLYTDPASVGALRASLRRTRAHVVDSVDFGPTEVFTLRPGEPMMSSLSPVGTQVDGAALLVTAWPNPAQAGRLVDGDSRTRWYSGRAQAGGERIQVVLEPPRRLSHLRIDMRRRSFADYPRRLVVETSIDGQHFAQVFEGSVLPSLARSLSLRPREPSIDIPLGGAETRVLRIRQIGRTPRRWFWSAHELRLWETPRAGEPRLKNDE
jgi:hypothetical protein